MIKSKKNSNTIHRIHILLIVGIAFLLSIVFVKYTIFVIKNVREPVRLVGGNWQGFIYEDKENEKKAHTIVDVKNFSDCERTISFTLYQTDRSTGDRNYFEIDRVCLFEGVYKEKEIKDQLVRIQPGEMLSISIVATALEPSKVKTSRTGPYVTVVYVETILEQYMNSFADLKMDETAAEPRMLEISSEGGTITRYQNEEEGVLRYQLCCYGETGRTEMDYYFMNDYTYYTVLNESYDIPISQSSGSRSVEVSYEKLEETVIYKGHYWGYDSASKKITREQEEPEDLYTRQELETMYAEGEPV